MLKNAWLVMAHTNLNQLKKLLKCKRLLSDDTPENISAESPLVFCKR